MAKIISILTGKELESMKALYLDSFGSLIGFRFSASQGSAEVLMTFPELQRLLEELGEYENSQAQPNQQVLGAIKILNEYLFGFPLGLVANVVIGQSHVRIQPDPPIETPD
ncbi:MAG: hypothetical protein SWH78_14095 [Thermodesulfobacteriota bacterium]|nr:hypothetical protein [Thermodesulfobacteriota bacterium]